MSEQEKFEAAYNLMMVESVRGLFNPSGESLAAAQRVINQPMTPTPEELRDEGRREILREIAKVRPSIDDDEHCRFCGSYLVAGHAPDCLWPRAQTAAKVEP